MLNQQSTVRKLITLHKNLEGMLYKNNMLDQFKSILNDLENLTWDINENYIPKYQVMPQHPMPFPFPTDNPPILPPMPSPSPNNPPMHESQALIQEPKAPIQESQPQQVVQPEPLNQLTNKMPVTNKTDIDLVKYLSIYRKYFNCKDNDIALFYMEFQYLLFIFKHSYDKHSTTKYCPGSFLHTLTHNYKKAHTLFISANSIFNVFLEREAKTLKTFFAFMHDLRAKDEVMLNDSKTYSELRTFLGDTRDINLHLEYYSKPKKEGEISDKELSTEEKTKKVFNLNKIKIGQIINNKLRIIITSIINKNMINYQNINLKELCSNHQEAVIFSQEFKNSIKPFLKELDSFDTEMKEKQQQKELKKLQKLKQEDKNQTSPPHDNKELTET
jgi:hypothetical protein